MEPPHFSDWGMASRLTFIGLLSIAAASVVIVLIGGPLWIGYLSFPSVIGSQIVAWREYRRAGVPFYLNAREDAFSANHPQLKLVAVAVGIAVAVMLIKF